jgi:hypothetical protein
MAIDPILSSAVRRGMPMAIWSLPLAALTIVALIAMI